MDKHTEQFLSQTLREKTGRPLHKHQSARAYFFRSGELIYKVPAQQPSPKNQTSELLIASRNLERLQTYAPALEGELLSLRRGSAGLYLGGAEHGADPIEYFIYQMIYFAPSKSLPKLLQKSNGFEAKFMQPIAESLISWHSAAAVNPNPQQGTHDHMVERLDYLFYQSSKHLDRTFTKAMQYITELPLRKFVSTNKKLFNKRVREGHNRVIHGCLIPSKFYIHGGGVSVLPHICHTLNEYGDCLLDIAELTLHLRMQNHSSAAELLLEHYFAHSQSTQLESMLAFYEIIACFQWGLFYSFLSADTTKTEGSEHSQHLQYQDTAVQYYQHACSVAQRLG